MAEFVDPKNLPECKKPVPNAKPPVYSLPYSEEGSPEEADEFNQFIREMRRRDMYPPE